MSSFVRFFLAKSVLVIFLFFYLLIFLSVKVIKLLLTVERYDPRSNRWTPVAPMSTRRKHLGCAVFQNHIFAVGGRDDLTELSSAEKYNPHTNTWTPVVAMNSKRSGVS